MVPSAAAWHYLQRAHHNVFSMGRSDQGTKHVNLAQICSAVPEIFDSQTNNRTQAGWFLRPDCAPRSECPQFGMPAERRALFQVPNVPRSRISERAPFWIYEHAQCRVFERTSLQRAYVIPCRQQMGSSAVLRARSSELVLAASMRCLRRAHSIGRGCRVHTCIMAIRADFKMYLLRQFCSNRVDFFTIHRTHRRKKRWTRNLKFEFCAFWEFFEIFKKASRGASAANLDHYGQCQTRSQ